MTNFKKLAALTLCVSVFGISGATAFSDLSGNFDKFLSSNVHLMRTQARKKTR